MINPRTFFASIFCPNEKAIFVFGGFDGLDDLQSCEKYLIDRNLWRKIPDLPEPRNGSQVI